MKRTRHYSLKQFFQDFYLVLILFFLYAPIVTMIVLSFNNTKSRSVWGGFTTHWYTAMFDNPTIMNALTNTLLIAFSSALIATILGTAAAIGIRSMRKTPRSIAMSMNNIPMMNSDIVTGISLMLAFIAYGISLGFKTVLIAHITFNVPYVILSVMPKLHQTNRSTYEAALDLGASPFQAFMKVIFPDIVPGVLSGFLMAFTMSLDDFIITHFTRGAGIDTLSTLIYSEVRRGIQPTMYALSSVIFITVLVLLLITNLKPQEPAHRARTPELKARRLAQKKRRAAARRIILITAVSAVMIVCGSWTVMRYQTAHSDVLYVYNAGEYIDESVIRQFEDETGIHVTYDVFETNEEMYPVIEAGAVQYDAVCPSDYMIQKMLENDLLAEINFDNVPNLSHIDPKCLEMARSFDPENRYSVPYTWGTVGILYNEDFFKQHGLTPPKTWKDLWNPALTGEILMQDSVRDAFMVSLKSLGYSANSTDINELQEAKRNLIRQKPLLQAYVVDQVRDKMIGGEAAVGVIYSGELLYIQNEIENQNLGYHLDYVIPEEGTNLWEDAWVIPKNAPNKENAEKWLNFLCRPDIAMKNFRYITYATPNKTVYDMLEPELQNNKGVFPDDSQLGASEVYKYLGDDADKIYNELWKEVKSE